MTNSPSNAPRRVVITGVGLISPLGNSPAELAAALAEGKSGVQLYESLASSDLPIRFAGLATDFTGQIDNFGPLEKDQKKAIRKGLKMMCRETQMAVAAAQLALNDAAVKPEDVAPEASGVVLGSDYMLTMPEDYTGGIEKCADNGEFDYARWGSEGLREMQPLWMLKYLPNMPASHIAIFNDFRGPNNSLTMRESGGLMALGEAYRMIARGTADQMVAGATGTRVLPMQAIHAMQTEPMASADAAPESASRPFDAGRTGMVAGEGAGMVILESLERAEARGAKIYGEVLGFGSSQVTDQELNGKNDVALANAMRSALRDAALEPNAIGHLNTHGLATKEDDIEEATAIANVFGDYAKSLPAVALKSNFGNLGAGSGVVELIASLLAFESGALPRVLNYAEPDPKAPIAAVTSDKVSPGARFVSVNTTPQGQAAAICVGRVG